MTPEQHCSLNLNLNIETVRWLWADLDDKRRLEVLKSVLWTAPDNHAFYDKALKEITSPLFIASLD